MTKDYDREIYDLELRIADLKRQKEKEAESEPKATLTPAQELAIKLHKKFCHWNHIDGCGFDYEYKKNGDHDWTRFAHKEYLDKAKKIIASGVEIKTALKLMDLV